MATIKLTLSGEPQLEAALNDLGGQIAGRLGRNAVRAGANVVVRSAKAKVPVRTGALRDSIKVFEDRFDNAGSVRKAYAGSRPFYAYWVEFGTAHVPPRSFLRAAIDESPQEIADKIAENLGRGIERETAKYGGR